MANIDDLDDDFEDEEGSAEGMSIHDIYAQLLLDDDIILTINKADYDSLKAGLTNVKAKENTKLKNKGMPVDSTKLQFTELPLTDECTELDMRIQVSLTKRKTFAIKKIEKAEGF